MALSNAFLGELAQAFGIATEFWDWKGRLTEVSDETVIAILKAMDVDASDPQKAQQALETLHNKPWTKTIPACIVMEQGRSWRVFAHVPHGEWIRLQVRLEDGGVWDVPQVEHIVPPRVIDGVLTGEAAFDLQPDLPIGYHRLQATTAAGQVESTLVVSPHFLGFPQRMGNKRVWGYAVQLYSTRSADSWGMGDLSDAADLASWSGSQQFADFMLVNPLHAAETVPPIEPSPYLPTSRRYLNPLYIRPEAIPEYAELDEDARVEIASIKAELHELVDGSPNILRNEIWPRKLAALRIIFEQGLRPARRLAFNDFLRREGRAVTQFATWSALCTVYGRDWREWPEAIRRPSSPEVADFTEANREDIVFYAWMQWIADTQLRAAQSAARDAGMRVGIMNDLAVGVGIKSSEAWIYGNLFAEGVTVGAPPDHYNQKGQDWAQIAWRPDRLEELSYAPFRSMVAGLLRHSGGIRVDHVMGLFRLWWIPEGMLPTQGTYVRYNHEAMVGILALEAYRAGALVVGEDLGVVEPWVRAYLRDRGVLGTSVAWFEFGDDGQPRAPEQWREYCMASVTTHD
ncbi:MAG: 4-alpha-glucanotransferase, partial [Propionibacteriaceae bacterium]|nr:4-alpha-glucanotransferase [Propionibacteriaceae bacterium]